MSFCGWESWERFLRRVFLHFVIGVSIRPPSKTWLLYLKVFWKYRFIHYSVGNTSEKYFPCVSIEVDVASIHNREHLHPKIMEQVAQRLLFPCTSYQWSCSWSWGKKKGKKIYFTLRIKPLNILFSFILSLVLSISLSLIKLWSIIKLPTVSPQFSEVWNILSYVFLGNFKFLSSLLSELVYTIPLEKCFFSV